MSASEDDTTLSYDECIGMLRRSSVGRVAVTSRALPVVIPVNYVLDGPRIVFRTHQDGTLARACDEAVVAFEIDEVAVDGRSGWSVLVVGLARLLDGSAALRATELNLVSAADNHRDQFVAISMGRVSGRAIPDRSGSEFPPIEVFRPSADVAREPTLDT